MGDDALLWPLVRTLGLLLTSQLMLALSTCIHPKKNSWWNDVPSTSTAGPSHSVRVAQ